MRSGIRTLAVLMVGFAALAIAAPAARAADCVLNDGRLKPEGSFVYNQDFKVMQYCDGTRWRTMLGGGIVDPELADLTDVDDALAPGNGDCLVYSSAAGEWQSQSCAAAAGGDDLGDHTADQNIILGTHWLSGDGGNEGVSISAAGTVAHSTGASGQIFTIATTNTGNSFLRVQNGVTAGHFGIGSATPHPALWSASGNLFIGNDGAPVLMIEGMAGTTGNIGIRTDDPSYPLDVNGTVRATAYLYASDFQLKEDIETLDGLALVRRLRGVSFTWKSTGKPATGVIAQEVEQVLPAAVSTDDQGMKAVDYQQLIGPLIEAVKSLDAEVVSLKTENDALRTRVEKLEASGGDER